MGTLGYTSRASVPGVVHVPVKFTTDANRAVTTATATGKGWTVARTAANTYRVSLTGKYVGVDGVFGEGVRYASDDVNGSSPYVDLTIPDVEHCGHISLLNPDAADLVSVYDATEPSNGAKVVALQPDYPRKLQVRVVDADESITAGTVTLVGVGIDGAAVGQTISLVGGTATTVTTDVYASVTSITVAALAGTVTGDTVGIGMGAALGLPIPNGAANVAVTRVVVDSASEAVGAGNGGTTAGLDSTGRALFPTTAPNATRDYDIFFTWGGNKSRSYSCLLALNVTGSRSGV
jgi:hypothetical protein